MTAVDPLHARLPVHCPVCGVTLAISRLTCEACGTRVSGHFTPCTLCILTEEEHGLVRHLVAAAGDLEAASAATGLGTDALRQRLGAIADRLGLPATAAPRSPSLDAIAVAEADADFLQRLALGVAEADEALRQPP